MATPDGSPAATTNDADSYGGPLPLREEFGTFYRREHAAVLALAYSLTGDRTVAEDVTQDAFFAAYRGWSTIVNPAGWVRTVVLNTSRSWFRRRFRELKAVARIGSKRADSRLTLPTPSHEFWDQVRQLPRRQAQCVALYYLEDRTTAEIAQLLGCAESTVRIHLTRGRRALATKLTIDDRGTDHA